MEWIAIISGFIIWAAIVLYLSYRFYYKGKIITVDDRARLMEDLELKQRLEGFITTSNDNLDTVSRYINSCALELSQIKNKLDIRSKIFFDNMQTRSFLHKYDICVDITVAAYLASGAAVGSWQNLHYDMLTSLAQSENKLPPGTNCVILRKLTREKDGTMCYIFEPTIIQVLGENEIIQGESFPQE